MMSEQEREFHIQRRMFAIINYKVYVAPENSTHSHYQWLIGEKLLRSELFDQIVRGYLLNNKLYIYQGDFSYDIKTFEKLISVITDLISELNLSWNTEIFIGMKKGKVGEQWEPLISLGKLKDLIYGYKQEN